MTQTIVGEFTHGHRQRKATTTYKSWQHMKGRCLNPNNKSYDNYGGRGITICDSWKQFENFLNDMGAKPPNTLLDRIDNEGNYEPSNCRWATWSESNKNRRFKLSEEQRQEIIQLRLTTNLTLRVIGDRFGVTPSCVHQIVNKSGPPELLCFRIPEES